MSRGKGTSLRTDLLDRRTSRDGKRHRERIGDVDFTGPMMERRGWSDTGLLKAHIVHSVSRQGHTVRTDARCSMSWRVCAKVI